MDEDLRLRYSRHLSLPGFGERAQERLAGSSALLVGLGGLGSAAAIYLASAGIGRLLLSDFDRVDLSNLQRQPLHRTTDLGRLKTDSALETLRGLNPLVACELLPHRLEGEDLLRQVSDADVVLDGSDNFGTRFAVNAACVATRTALISGAAIRWEGQLAVFNPADDASPCYRCLYQESDEGMEDCRGNGVLAPLVGVIGSLMASEAIKLLSRIGPPTAGRLQLFDALQLQWREVRIRRDPACTVCGGQSSG